MAKKYRGKYIGIVITAASEDPEGRNRVQVWVPHVMNTLYKDWNSSEDDKFLFDLNRGNLTSPEIQRLRNSLPWAECASFLIGGGAPFTTNRATRQTSTSTERTLDERYDFNSPLEDVPLDPNLNIGPEEPLPDLAPLPDASPAPPTTPQAPVIVIPDTPANNAPGSGNDLPPVEPDLPVE